LVSALDAKSLKYDEPLSNVAFNFNLRHYSKGWTVLRPDLASPPLEWDQYLAWVRAQSKAGVAVLEAGS